MSQNICQCFNNYFKISVTDVGEKEENKEDLFFFNVIFFIVTKKR